jgi:hypothetical protein
LRILKQFVIKNNKYSEEKQACLKLRLAVTMPTAFVRSYTDMRRISYHFLFIFFLYSANSREHVDTFKFVRDKTRRHIEIAQHAFQQ